jgi:hypothetical protein
LDFNKPQNAKLYQHQKRIPRMERLKIWSGERMRVCNCIEIGQADERNQGEQMKTAAVSAIKLAKIVAKAIKKDRDHLARLNKTYYVGRFNALVFGKAVPNFACKHFEIVNGELWNIETPKDEKPNADGATLCPDKIGAFDLAPAWIPHDHGYPWIDIMAQDPLWIEAGWDAESIRALWDGVLGDIALYKAGKLSWPHAAYAKPTARGIYAGTRIGGGFARWVYNRFQIALLVAAVAFFSSSGCRHVFTPPGIFQPSDIDPDYTIEAR